ncbi:cytidine/deoxycytidylate deaminase family protein [Patescibacteria group bacterium]
MKKVLFLYIPVLHQGYVNIFQKYAAEVDCLWILGEDLVHEFMFLEREIRAINPHVIRRMVESLNLFKSIHVLYKHSICQLSESEIITAKECLMERFISKYFPGSDVVYDTVFLRWDESHVSSKEPVNYDRISTDDFDIEMVQKAAAEGSRTSDWWREVGGIIIKDGAPLFTSHNKHVPSEHSCYVHGDIRDVIKPGEHSDISSALHAEQGLITEAARLVLEGTSIYLSVFPCPSCAKMIAYSGIKKVYFSGGHASFDGVSVLKANGVELIFVKE